MVEVWKVIISLIAIIGTAMSALIWIVKVLIQKAFDKNINGDLRDIKAILKSQDKTDKNLDKRITKLENNHE